MNPAEWREGVLHSRLFDDIYCSRDGGLAETKAVFLAGCHLPEHWQGKPHFTVAELGFGTGLNMLVTLALWEKHRPKDGHLQLFSVEGFPLQPEDAARALAATPEVGHLAGPLLARWPCLPGFHRFYWPRLKATLDVAIGEVEPMLEAWDGKADAWFLDGFAPARNPAMWTPVVLTNVARHAAPGTTLATYTVAAAVRRGLTEAGFAIRRCPGFGHKRERLEAQIGADEPANTHKAPDIAIIGAGIAGTALCRAFRALGVAPTLYSSGEKGASHNKAALLAPLLPTANRASLYLQAYEAALALIKATAPEAILARGALRFPRGPREARKLQKAADLRPDLFQPIAWEEAGALLGEEAPGPGFLLPSALTIEPHALHKAWGTPPQEAHVRNLQQVGKKWLFAGHTADIVVVAAGMGSSALTGLPLSPVRGQLNLAEVPLHGMAAADGHYLVPTRSGLLFGASYGFDEARCDSRAEDTADNLEKLARLRPRLAASLSPPMLRTQTGVRAVPPGATPYAGQLASGLFLLAGFGGHGFTLAPLLAEHVAALALGCPSPLPRALQQLLSPQREACGAGALAPH